MATEAQLLARARVIARDQDPEGYDQGGMLTADWLDELNGARLDFYIAAGELRSQWVWPLAYVPHSYVTLATTDDVYELPAISGVYELQDLWWGDPRPHRGTSLEYQDDWGRLEYLQERRPSTGSPQMVAWRRMENGLWQVAVWPTPAGKVARSFTASNISNWTAGDETIFVSAGSWSGIDAPVDGAGTAPTPSGSLILTEAAAKIGTLPRGVLSRNAGATSIRMYPGTSLDFAGGANAIVIGNYPLILGGYARMYPTTMTGGATDCALGAEQFEWVAAIAAARAMAILSDDPAHVSAIAARIGESYQSLAMAKRGERSGPSK